MANLGRALMSGLVAGFGQYAGMKMDEKQKAEQAERDRKLAELQDKLMRQKAQFEASLKGDTFNTFEDTDAQGNTIKRTVRSGYDPEKGKYSEEIGSAIKPKAAPITRNVPMGMNDTVQEFDPATGKWNEIGSGPRFAPRPLMPSAGEGKNKDEEFLTWYSGLTDEQRRLYDQGKGRAVRPDLDAKLMTIANSSLNARMRDFDKKEERDRKSDYKAFGIDPDAKDARKQLRNAMQEEIYGSYGLEMPVEETVEVIEAGPGNQPPTRNPSGSSRSNPVKVSSPAEVAKLPPGTWVLLPNGQTRQK